MRYLIIIPAADKDRANAAAQAHFDALGGAFTFTVPLFLADAETDETPSHYWCSAEVAPANVPTLLAMQAGFPSSHINEYDLAAQPDYPQDRLATLGLRTARPVL